VTCGRQFIDHYDPPKGYSDEVKRECLRMYVSGLGFRAIERVKGVHHTTVILWVKQEGIEQNRVHFIKGAALPCLHLLTPCIRHFTN